MMDRSKYLVLAAVFCVASSGTALDATRQAVAAESSYTPIAEKHCRKFDRLKIDGSEFAASRVCEGRGGYKIFIREDDLRETLTMGRRSSRPPMNQPRPTITARSTVTTTRWNGEAARTASPTPRSSAGLMPTTRIPTQTAVRKA
jgi:hypothetical protein